MTRSKLVEDQVKDVDFVAPDEHEGLHDLDSYIEITRTNGRVTLVEEWKDDSKNHKYSSTVLSRTNGKVSLIEKTIYDYETGTSGIAVLTTTLVRDQGRYFTITSDRDVDVEGI